VASKASKVVRLTFDNGRINRRLYFEKPRLWDTGKQIHSHSEFSFRTALHIRSSSNKFSKVVADTDKCTVFVQKIQHVVNNISTLLGHYQNQNANTCKGRLSCRFVAQQEA